jgi:hypothetical protein
VRLLVAGDVGVCSPDGAQLPGTRGVDIQQLVLRDFAAPGSSEATVLQAALLATGQLVPAPGSSSTQARMRQLLDAQQHHGLLLLGAAAAQPATQRADFVQQMQPILTRVPLAAVPGPAQGDGGSSVGASAGAAPAAACAAHLERQLRMPRAFTLGAVHVVMLDTRESLAQDSPQYQ